MRDDEDLDASSVDAKYDAIITDAQLAIPAKGATERFTVRIRIGRELLLNRGPDFLPPRFPDARDIVANDRVVIDDLEP